MGGGNQSDGWTAHDRRRYHCRVSREEMTMRRLAVILLIMLGACTSMEEMRGAAPVFSGQFVGNYIDVASCTVRAFSNSPAPTLIVDQATQTATLTGIHQDGWTRFPLYEATLHQETPAGGVVVMRSVRTAFGVPQGETAWNILAACGRTPAGHRAAAQR